MKKLLLFDIDGTILNMKKGVSKNIFIDTFFDVYNQKITLEQMPVFSGNTDLQILQQMAQAIGFDGNMVAPKLEQFWQLKLERFKHYCTPDYIQLIPGVSDLITELKSNNDYEIALLTGNSKLNARQKLSSYELDRYFDCGAFGCDSPVRSDLPPLAIDRVNHFVNQNLYSFNNSIIIGDTLADIKAAKDNNMNVMIVSDTKDFELFKSNNSDSLVNDFTDIDYFYSEIDRISK
jgi:phosphoglycolate phosphatase-like HAD superfamily hydrolase